jgi:hypothetical protein
VVPQEFLKVRVAPDEKNVQFILQQQVLNVTEIFEKQVVLNLWRGQ